MSIASVMMFPLPLLTLIICVFLFSLINLAQFSTGRKQLYPLTIPHEGIFGNIQRHFQLSQFGTWSGQRPGMLPHIVQCIRPLRTKHYPSHNISRAEVEKLVLGFTMYTFYFQIICHFMFNISSLQYNTIFPLIPFPPSCYCGPTFYFSIYYKPIKHCCCFCFKQPIKKKF